MTRVIDNLGNPISDAVAHYWQTRKLQKEKQKNKGVSDAGLRSAVTGYDDKLKLNYFVCTEQIKGIIPFDK